MNAFGTSVNGDAQNGLTREQSTRLVVLVPLTPLAAGDAFAVKDWPLHITVLAPFHTRKTHEQVAAVIAEVAATQPALTARAGAEAMFGRGHDIPVTLVCDHPGLTRLHDRLLEALRPLAARPEEPAFTGSKFRAHVTVKGARRARAGEEFILSQVALVDMAPRAHAAGRAVLATVPLLPNP